MLKKFIKSFKYGRKGFTLIELLVVVAILGILAAVVIPNVARFIGSGKLEAAKTEVDNLQVGITAFMADHKFGYATEEGTSTGTAITPGYLVDNGYINKAVVGDYTISNVGGITGNRYPADDTLAEEFAWGSGTWNNLP